MFILIAILALSLIINKRSTNKEFFLVNKIMFQNKKGFTLIELMVVIAIIAILATVVLVALQGARDAAQDSKRKSSTTQVRSVAEVHYATRNQSYSGLGDDNGATPPVYVNSEIGQLMAAHGPNDGNLQINVNGDGDAYCAVIELVGHAVATPHTFCVSNSGAPGERTADPAGGCTSINFTCNND